MRSVAAAALGLSLLFFGGTIPAKAQQGACDPLREQWVASFTLLQRGAEEYRRIKEESVGPSISKHLQSRSETNIARAVRAVLAERKRRMAEAETRLRSLAEEERVAFRRWNDCNPGGRWAKAGSPSQTPRSVTNERRQLRAAIDDLLLDEAYLQYKHTSPRRPPEYSDYNAPGYWR
jgi:hypothetical protein